MDSACKQCNELESKQDNPALKCIVCQKMVHLKCLTRPGTPGDFAGDVFFDYTCIHCTESGQECFTRNKMSWVNAILLTLHHLNIQSHGISHHGFFHYKTHIASFIDRHWHLLFGTQVKQKKNWMGTIAGTLSVYNGLVFRSGSGILGETGWWKLKHNFSPALAAHIIIEMARDRPKGRARGQIGMDKTMFYAKVKALGYMDYLVVEKEIPISGEPTPKKARLISETELETARSSCDQDGRSTSDVEPRSEPDSMLVDEPYMCLSGSTSYADMESFFTGYQLVSHAAAALASEHNDSSSERTHTTTDAGAAPDDSDSHHSPQFPQSPQFPNSPQFPQSPRSPRARQPLELDERPAPNESRSRITRSKNTEFVVRRESLFSTQLNSVDSPWLPKEDKSSSPAKDLVELTEYEEIQLLKQVENLIEKVRDVEKKAYLCRLRAKLALRRLKRHKHLPIFDFDKTVKVLGGYVADAPKAVASVERVLDRFQRAYLVESLSGAMCGGGGVVLAAAPPPAPLRSPHSGALLKPFIRRDSRARPLWLRLTDELLLRTHRDVPGYTPPPAASLDYSYVRPQHLPAVNSLCAQFFWPGIDLTEALQQPEYSCVVSYRRLVVGCAFLVADAAPGQAYISFVLTRPEWRRAGIATFMLYHLLQTCTGKDVTLHVSPTNPAIFLYQKFGFKVEELVQDFYEKYYDIDHKGCRHALFLRLVR